MKNQFDIIAPFYDRLARIFFGSSWNVVQRVPATRIPVGKVLIVGGGTGRVLSHLTNQHQVVYVELSYRMLEKAKARETSAKVTFVHTDFLEYQSDQQFDHILYPFFLDVFNPDNLKTIVIKTVSLLESRGSVHILDFQHSGWWRNLLVKGMYVFFQWVSRLEGSALRDFQKDFVQAGFIPIHSQPLLQGWVAYQELKRPE